MGTDKASISVHGEVLSHRIARGLLGKCERVTVVGLEPLPVPNLEFVRDQEEYQGPLVALGLVTTKSSLIFVASCDLVRFDPSLIDYLASKIGDAKAAMVLQDGFPQPLCALYRADAFATIRHALEAGNRKVIRWASDLSPVYVSQQDLADARLDPRCFMGANTPEELEKLLID